MPTAKTLFPFLPPKRTQKETAKSYHAYLKSILEWNQTALSQAKLNMVPEQLELTNEYILLNRDITILHKNMTVLYLCLLQEDKAKAERVGELLKALPKQCSTVYIAKQALKKVTMPEHYMTALLVSLKKFKEHQDNVSKLFSMYANTCKILSKKEETLGQKLLEDDIWDNIQIDEKTRKIDQSSVKIYMETMEAIPKPAAKPVKKPAPKPAAKPKPKRIAKNVQMCIDLDLAKRHADQFVKDIHETLEKHLYENKIDLGLARLLNNPEMENGMAFYVICKTMPIKQGKEPKPYFLDKNLKLTTAISNSKLFEGDALEPATLRKGIETGHFNYAKFTVEELPDDFY